jgi:cytochrome P450
VTIKKGQRVVMVYRSANFDEEVFDDPYVFNIVRDPTRTSDSAAPELTTALAPTSPA